MTPIEQFALGYPLDEFGAGECQLFSSVRALLQDRRSERGSSSPTTKVIEAAEAISVTLSDGCSFDACAVGRCQFSCAAIKRDTTDLRPIALGSSVRSQVDDCVVEVGNQSWLEATEGRRGNQVHPSDWQGLAIGKLQDAVRIVAESRALSSRRRVSQESTSQHRPHRLDPRQGIAFPRPYPLRHIGTSIGRMPR
jgi:hypothetical protein